MGLQRVTHDLATEQEEVRTRALRNSGKWCPLFLTPDPCGPQDSETFGGGLSLSWLKGGTSSSCRQVAPSQTWIPRHWPTQHKFILAFALPWENSRASAYGWLTPSPGREGTHWWGRVRPRAPGRACSTCTVFRRIHRCNCRFLSRKREVWERAPASHPEAAVCSLPTDSSFWGHQLESAAPLSQTAWVQIPTPPSQAVRL